jgi:pimeloyl-ACP methyl ester carboxylesterase
VWTGMPSLSLTPSLKKCRLSVGRPAFGGSTPVAIDVRMRVWLETVPALLRAVGVQHVALVAHSAGAVYALNTLLRCRGVLEKRVPYVAFLGKWTAT